MVDNTELNRQLVDKSDQKSTSIFFFTERVSRGVPWKEKRSGENKGKSSPTAEWKQTNGLHDSGEES